MTSGQQRDRDEASQEAAPRPRSRATLLTLLACAAFLFALFAALGTWQVYRLQWKRALIERVEQRVHAAPVPAPGPKQWAQVSAASDEYRRVTLTGVYLHSLAAKTLAATELGSGFWLLTPFCTREGSIVLVNRGFISAEAGAAIPMVTPSASTKPCPPAGSAGEVTVTGLLRISEPAGGYLRDNDPANDRWFSRDVQAIAAVRNLEAVAPYFVDADRASEPGDGSAERPVGGLTVISFYNNHLMYALTWYALALMVAGAGWWIWRHERTPRRSTHTG